VQPYSRLCFPLPFIAWVQISPCDLNSDGVTDAADVTAAVNMATWNNNLYGQCRRPRNLYPRDRAARYQCVSGASMRRL
jgi:hypothetical protein